MKRYGNTTAIESIDPAVNKISAIVPFERPGTHLATLTGNDSRDRSELHNGWDSLVVMMTYGGMNEEPAACVKSSGFCVREGRGRGKVKEWGNVAARPSTKSAQLRQSRGRGRTLLAGNKARDLSEFLLLLTEQGRRRHARALAGRPRSAVGGPERAAKTIQGVCSGRKVSVVPEADGKPSEGKGGRRGMSHRSTMAGDKRERV
ncbi:hypothetical protein K488DRAFT_75336 [Vararia minispora EC-137]|uniref:Uncharacterized protein n=1 Tax=Vararia minispora EC-137 TaxID=1314806 RepID=A0ACB8Q4A1_9AGAM|nr:hypothetical protein K488DRAFT_75336 [Vararia minispora EC-137]